MVFSKASDAEVVYNSGVVLDPPSFPFLLPALQETEHAGNELVQEPKGLWRTPKTLPSVHPSLWLKRDLAKGGVARWDWDSYT